MVGGHRSGQPHDEPLTLDRRERPDSPGRQGVAVEGHRRAVLRRVADGVAVAGRLHGRDPAPLDDGGRVAARAREDVQAVVGRVVHQRSVADGLGGPRVLAHAAPALAALAVGVGEHQVGTGIERRLADVGAIVEAGVVEHELAPVEQAGGSQVDEPVPAAGHEDRLVGRRRAHDGRRARHAERGDRRCIRLVVRQPERLLVEEGQLVDRAVGRGRAVGHGGVETRGGGDRRPRGPRAGREVALVLEVVAGHDLPGRDQPGERGERRRLEPALLQPPLVGDQQVRALRRPPRHELAGDVGPVRQAGRDRVDRAAPSVRGEVDARQLVHPGRGVPAEGLDGLLVGGGHLLGAEEVVGVQPPGEQRGQVEGDQERGPEGGRHGEARRSRAPTASTPAPSSNTPAEGDERHGPRRRAQRQPGRRAHEGLDQAAEGARVVVRMGSHGDRHRRPGRARPRTAGATNARRRRRAGRAPGWRSR